MNTSELVVATLEIIGVDILLGGDNALVIALACRSLPKEQQKKAIVLGTAGAIVIRAALTMFAVLVLGLPWLKLIGGALLLWIGVKLLVPDSGDGHGAVADNKSMFAAIRTIVIADLVMSLDNVLAVAAAAKDHMGLVAFGLLFSIPIIVYGSSLIIKLMDRLPVVITLGGAMLGYIAGEMIIKDPLVGTWLGAHGHWLHYAIPVGCALGVVGVGRALAARARAAAAAAPVVEISAHKSD